MCFMNIMGISNLNRVGNKDIYDSTSANISKKDKTTDAFQDIMGMVSFNRTETNGTGKLNEENKNKDTFLPIDKKANSNNGGDDYKKNIKNLDSSRDDNLRKTTSESEKEVNQSRIGDRKKERTDDSASSDTSVKETNTESKQLNKDDSVEITKIEDIIVKITALIEKVFDLSTDELKNTLSELELNISDLLDDSGIQKFVLYLNGASEIDMICNETLNQDVFNLIESIGKLINDFGFESKGKLIEEVKEFVNTLEGDTEIVSGKTVEITETEDATNFAQEDGKIIAERTDIDSKFESSSHNDSSNHMSQETNLIDGIANALSNAVSKTENVSSFEGDVEAADIVRQVVEEIKTNINDKVRSLQIKLNPENLGRVQISVTTKNGVMQAKIIVETESAKNAIEHSIALLKETFENQDLKVEAVEVMIANYDFFKEEEEANNDGNNDKNSASGGNAEDKNDDILVEDISEAEKIELDMMQQSGNSVSYAI